MSHRFFRILGPSLIALTTLVMLIWSWDTWPDPLVDFGGQLYVPWQLVTGHVLYRDVTYYNGPLSSYFNAALFRLFGVGLHTLVIANLVILLVAMILAYRLTVRASDRLSAIMAGLTFVLIFAFSQVVRLGNYNWITPYHHELTHGAVLGLAAIACVERYQRSNYLRWIAATGTLLGAIFLTKAEPTAAAFAAVSMQLASGWWMDRTNRRHILVCIALLIGCTIALPLIAFMLLTIAMPAGQALSGVSGSWPWALDSRITSLHFYREVAGLNNIHGNLLTMLHWTLIYAVLLGSGVGAGLLCRSTRRQKVVTIAAFFLCSVLIACQFSQQVVPGMLTPLPICLLGTLLITGASIIKRSSPKAALRFGLVIFATVLAAKMGFATLAYHYGFVLTWPATVVLICAVAKDIPDWVDRHGGAGHVVRAVGLSAWLAAVAAILYSDKINLDKKSSLVAADTSDEFRGDGRGVMVQQICDRIAQRVPPTATVMVLPQGLMINYLTRRSTPTPYVNLMPPEVLAVGEQTILAAVNQHPPDVIVLTPAVIENGYFTLDSHDPYGADMFKWVMKNYVVADSAQVSQPLQLLVRKK